MVPGEEGRALPGLRGREETKEGGGSRSPQDPIRSGSRENCNCRQFAWRRRERSSRFWGSHQIKEGGKNHLSGAINAHCGRPVKRPCQCRGESREAWGGDVILRSTKTGARRSENRDVQSKKNKGGGWKEKNGRLISTEETGLYLKQLFKRLAGRQREKRGGVKKRASL